MSVNEIHKSDVGTTFRATIVDGSTAVELSSSTFTAVFFAFLVPDTTATNTVTATAWNSDGSDGKVNYTVTSDTFLSTIGAWEVQAIVSVSPSNWHSDIHKFTVHKNL